VLDRTRRILRRYGALFGTSVVALALIAAVIRFAQSKLPEATLAIVAGAIGLLCGAGIRLLEAAIERERRRRSLATALLSELRSAELDMQLLLRSPHPGDGLGDGVRAPTFRRVYGSDELTLFRPETVGHIARLVSVAELIAEYRRAFGHYEAPEKALINAEVWAKAYFLAVRVADLKTALLEEGGTPPPPDPVGELVPGKRPPIPDSAFSDWAVPPAGEGGMLINDRGETLPGDHSPRSG
jgi:hypothetical protein